MFSNEQTFFEQQFLAPRIEIIINRLNILLEAESCDTLTKQESPKKSKKLPTNLIYKEKTFLINFVCRLQPFLKKVSKIRIRRTWELWPNLNNLSKVFLPRKSNKFRFVEFRSNLHHLYLKHNRPHVSCERNKRKLSPETKHKIEERNLRAKGQVEGVTFTTWNFLIFVVFILLGPKRHNTNKFTKISLNNFSRTAAMLAQLF